MKGGNCSSPAFLRESNLLYIEQRRDNAQSHCFVVDFKSFETAGDYKANFRSGRLFSFMNKLERDVNKPWRSVGITSATVKMRMNVECQIKDKSEENNILLAITVTGQDNNTNNLE